MAPPCQIGLRYGKVRTAKDHGIKFQSKVASSLVGSSIFKPNAKDETKQLTARSWEDKSVFHVYRYTYLKQYTKFTVCIKSQVHFSHKYFLYSCIHLSCKISC